MSGIAPIFGLVLLLWNRGLLMLPVFGAVILLRPVTNRLLRPKYRVWLWMAGWFMCSIYYLNADAFSAVRLLPFTLRSVVQPRSSWESGAPAYLPDRYMGSGEYSAVLPGGTQIPIFLDDTAACLLTLAFIGSYVLVSRLSGRLEQQEKRMVEVAEQYFLPEHPELGWRDGTVLVRICRGLSTSFVMEGRDPELEDVRYIICLQEELSEERRELVLRHEVEHLRQNHLWFKILLAVALILFWWNPLVWAAYRLTCRDMELACDEAVMAGLTPEQCREYARTLLELGAGKQFWGVQLTFGECDAAVRVRNAVRWRKERLWRKPLAVALTVLLGLFLFTNPVGPTKADSIYFVEYLHSAEAHPCIDSDLRAQFGSDCGVEDIWLTGGETVLVETTDGRWVYGGLMKLEHSIPQMQFVEVEENRARYMKEDAIDFPR